MNSRIKEIRENDIAKTYRLCYLSYFSMKNWPMLIEDRHMIKAVEMVPKSYIPRSRLRRAAKYRNPLNITLNLRWPSRSRMYTPFTRSAAN